MNRVIVKGWYGRLGNNIIQLINAIKSGKNNRYNTVLFPQHREFNCREIIFDSDSYGKLDDLYDDADDNFYWKAIRGKIDMNAKIFFRIFIQYVKPIIIYNLESQVEYELCVHIRGADSKYSKEYVPFPLAFVNSITGYKDMIIITEDINMPVAKYLYSNKIGRWRKQSVEQDLRFLTNARRLALSYGTFSLVAVLYSIIHGHLKELYLPDYVYNRWKDNWKVDVKDIVNPETSVIIINLPNYLKVGEFVWSPHTQKFMLDYKPS